MLIYLSDEVVKSYAQNKLDSIQSPTFYEIICSNTLGTHFVYGSGLVLRYLSQSNKVSERDRQIFTHMYNTRSTIEPYLNSIKHKIIVNIQDSIINYKNEFEVEVNLNFFRITNALHNAYIISEDNDDCNFYCSITENLNLIKNDLMTLSYSIENGGGDNTASSFEEKAVEKKHITYTILDSDKKFEEDRTGNTYNKVLAKFRKKDDENLAKLYLLNVHEKENLIPPTLYRTLNVDQQVAKILYKISIDKDMVNFLKYLDLKEGLHSLNYNQYYDDLVQFLINEELIGASYGTYSGTLTDLHNDLSILSKLPKKEKEANKFFIIKPLSSNPLKEFDLNKQIKTCKTYLSNPRNEIERLKNKKKLLILTNFYKTLLDFQKNEFNKIASDIYELSIAYNNKLII